MTTDTMTAPVDAVDTNTNQEHAPAATAGPRARLKLRRRIEKIADKEATRYILSAVQVIPAPDDKVYIEVTDGRHAAIVQEQGYTDQAHKLPATMTAKNAKHADKGLTVELTDHWRAEDRIAEEPDGRFPRISDIFPKNIDQHLMVILNPRFLVNLRDAIGETGRDCSEGITLFLPPPDPKSASNSIDGTVIVTGPNGIGLVMTISPQHKDGPTRSSREYQYKEMLAGYSAACDTERQNQAARDAAAAKQ